MPGISIREHGYGSWKNEDYAYDTWRDRQDDPDHAQQQLDEERRRAEEDLQSNQQQGEQA